MTTYSSVQRSDWHFNFIENQASVSVVASFSAYNPVAGVYLMQLHGIGFAPGDQKGHDGVWSLPQPSKMFCRRISGGAPTAGRCGGVY